MSYKRQRPEPSTAMGSTSGLLRQYLPRTADLRRFSQADLDRIATELNDRPRQILGFQTPSRVFAEALR
jgi:IS30 family transposase